MRESEVWWLVFVGAFVVTALAETFWPWRALATSTPRRWVTNSFLLAASSIVLGGAYQLTGIAIAAQTWSAQQGLLPRIGVPNYVSLIAGILALDLTQYIGHRIMHGAGLWRVHSVHHSETDLDLTTGFRFHPLESIVTRGLQIVVIALLGPPPLAVLAAALGMVAQNFVTHANLNFSPRVDRAFQWLIVTPAMHRVHHLQSISDQNSNFGTIFSLWDRLLGTYHRPAPANAQGSACGLADEPAGSTLSAAALLKLPFRSK